MRSLPGSRPTSCENGRSGSTDAPKTPADEALNTLDPLSSLAKGCADAASWTVDKLSEAVNKTADVDFTNDKFLQSYAVVFAAAASAVLFVFEERILAVTNRRADYLKHVIRGGSPQTFDVLNRKWLVGTGGEIYHYQYFDPRRSELNALSVLRFDPTTHSLVQRVYATQASYQSNPSDARAWTARAAT